MRALGDTGDTGLGVGSREAYRLLELTFARVSALRSLQGLLGWDSNVALPRAAADARGRQTAVVLEVMSETLADPRLAEWLDRAAGADLDPWERANLTEMGRQVRLSLATPTDLSGRLADASSSCEMAWRTAKSERDFTLVRAPLERLFAIARDLAAARAEVMDLSPFDAMMEAWEPGARTRALDGAFDRLARVLPGIAGEAAERSTKAPVPEPTYEPEAQMRAAKALAAHLGFSEGTCRLDPCQHAFFMDDNPDDLRIGLRLEAGPLLPMLSGLIHEIGHARHERNGPAAWRGQPVGGSRSAAVQESQALLLEMMVGRSDAFWRTAAPVVNAALGAHAADLDCRGVVERLRHVRPGPLRVGADEVSYGLHIVLRYRLERDLIEADLAVADLPDAWRDASEALFGFVPDDDAEGCLQDIHWYSGLLGYFPSYAQGQWIAAQFIAGAERDLPGLWDGEGRFDDLAEWLKVHVHAQGRRLSTEDLVREATGAAPSPDAFLSYLQRRYLGRDPS
jgi:carboxypeptidase Taq